MRLTHRLLTAASGRHDRDVGTMLSAATAGEKPKPSGWRHNQLREYAADTWRSMAAMADPGPASSRQRRR
jgi:hypothetical protein